MIRQPGPTDRPRRRHTLIGVSSLACVLVAGAWLAMAGTAAARSLAPAITSQPVSQTVSAGASATFTATASGRPTPTVHWQVSTDGATWNNITGATSTTLTLTSVTIALSGDQYEAVFTNYHGTQTTHPARLTVVATPPPPPPPPPPPTGTYWQPGPVTSFNWVIGHPIDLTNSNDMGGNGVLYTGGAAPSPQVFDIDGFDNPASTVASLHALGKKVICYLSIGTYENWRPDASSFPAGLLGSGNGWPGEKWLNTSPAGPYYAQLQAIMTARLQMCASKGFDGVEFDNMDVSENSSGFSITNAQNNQYVTWLAATAHSLSLAAFQKNYVDQASVLQPSFDGVIDEQCYQYSECSGLTVYPANNKPVWQVEYSSSPASFCPASNGLNFNAYKLPLNLDATSRITCR
jgi:hypothetical protein